MKAMAFVLLMLVAVTGFLAIQLVFTIQDRDDWKALAEKRDTVTIVRLSNTIHRQRLEIEAMLKELSKCRCDPDCECNWCEDCGKNCAMRGGK